MKKAGMDPYESTTWKCIHATLLNLQHLDLQTKLQTQFFLLLIFSKAVSFLTSLLNSIAPLIGKLKRERYEGQQKRHNYEDSI